MSIATPAPLRRRVHSQSVEPDAARVTKALQEQLGQSLTAFIVGRDERTVSRWAKGETAPSAESERALRNTYQVFALIAEADSAGVARAWFMGMNPELGDDSPAEALNEGRWKEVMAAARTYTRAG